MCGLIPPMTGRGMKQRGWREMESNNEKAARCSSSVAAQEVIYHEKNFTTGAQTGQGRSGATVSDPGERHGKVSVPDTSRFWRTVNVGEKIAQAGGGA